VHEVGSALEHIGCIRKHACRSVCEMGRCARTNASEFERRPMSMIERKGYIRTQSAKINTLKIFTNTNKNNYKYLHTNIYPNSSIA
jgi:hypothetical protein